MSFLPTRLKVCQPSIQCAQSQTASSTPTPTPATGSFRRPVALAAGEAVFGGLALEIRRRRDELRTVHVVERVHIDHGVPRALDLAGRDRHHAAGGADMEIRRLRAEPVQRDPFLVGDGQREAALGVRGPDASVLRAQAAAAGAHRDRRPGAGPVEGEADVAAMTAAVDLPIGDGVGHERIGGRKVGRTHLL